MAETKLKPCPFCAGKAERESPIPRVHFVQCLKCFASTEIQETQGAATRAWNKREGAEEEWAGDRIDESRTLDECHKALGPWAGNISIPARIKELVKRVEDWTPALVALTKERDEAVKRADEAEKKLKEAEQR